MFNTREDRNSNGALNLDSNTGASNAYTANIVTAYNAGATGAGITVAIVDSGINPALSEFAGRISSASADVAGTRGVSDEDGHGTSIAGVIAAARDGSSIHGIAYEATILSLRSDDPGSCGTEDGCSHSDNSIARGIDAAVSGGAKVINLSLGGSAANLTLRNAIQRATRAGVIIVMSAGNEGEVNPDAFAQIASNSTVANGLVIIAGSVDSTGTISSFSDRAGSFGAYYLAALGERVRSFDHTGAAFLFSGTSYSTPIIAGALALLRQAYPTLTPQQIVSLLFASATDKGDAGVDAIYGSGLLNLANAFTPKGATALAGSKVAVSTTDNGELGGALGDGGQVGTALKGAIILDGYGRAFTMDVARTVSATPAPRVLGGLSDRSLVRGGGSAVRYTLTMTPAETTRPWVGLAQQGLDNRAAERDRVRQGLAVSTVGKGNVGAAFGYSPQTLVSAVGGSWSDGGFLAAGRGGFDAGFATRGGTAVAYARAAGRWTLSFAGGHAEVDGRRPGLRGLGDVDTVAVRAEHPVGPVRLAGGIAQMRESETLLGSSSTALGLSGAVTRFATLEARSDLGSGWSLSGSARRGWTDAKVGTGLLESVGTVRSSAFEATLSKAGLFGGDRLDLRLSQPLRVDRAVARFSVPVSYDYYTLGTGYETRSANLAPTGREIDAEAVYATQLFGGDIDAHLFWRRDPGHVAAHDADVGLALRFAKGF